MMMSSSSSSSSSGYTGGGKTGKKLKGGVNGVVNRKALNQERIIALQQDVEKLRKKLRVEENIHRAMERAFNRPLGTLPRLTPFLPPPILVLLVEVAVLEEEIVRLEEHMVNFRQMLYQEAVFKSSSKTNLECSVVLPKSKSASSNARESVSPLSREPVSVSESPRGKQNKLRSESTIKMQVKKMPFAHTQLNKSLEDQKLQIQQEGPTRRKTNAEPRSYVGADENSDPNKISENLVKCLSNIYMRMSSVRSHAVTESQENDKDTVFRDPYGIC